MAGTMNCVTVSGFGAINDKVAMSVDRVKPELPRGKEGHGKMLVKVLACALAPGDVRVLCGHCDYFQAPKEFPYIPGGDICGIVQEVHDADCGFEPGDCVVVAFGDVPFNGLAEYALVECRLAEKKPENLDAVHAASLPSSAVTAMTAAQWHVRKGDRVLVIGGGSGVGTSLVQMVRMQGASYVAATSTDEKLLAALGVDRIINRKLENWWELDRDSHEPFDVVLDCWGGRAAWEHVKGTDSVLKSGWKGGRYVTLVGDHREMQIHDLWQALWLALTVLLRMLITALWPWLPKYTWHMGFEVKPGRLAELFRTVESGHLKVVLDPASPFEFTERSVQTALHLQKSRRAHGKVVVKVSEHSQPAKLAGNLAGIVHVHFDLHKGRQPHDREGVQLEDGERVKVHMGLAH